MTRLYGFVQRLNAKLRTDVVRAWNTGVVHLTASTWTVRAAQVVQRVILARILGAENIGHLAVVNSSMNLFRIPAGVGTFTVVNKLMAENANAPEARKRVLGTSLRINTVAAGGAGFLALVVLTSTTWIRDPVANLVLRWLLLLLPFSIFADVFRNALIGRRRVHAVAWTEITVSISGILLVVPMALSWGFTGWVMNQVFAVLAGVLAFAWCIREDLSWQWDRMIASRIFRISIFAFLGQAVGALILQFDTLSVSALTRDAAATGVYNSASLVAQQMLAVPASLLTVVFPFVAENRSNLPRLRARYRELLSTLLCVCGGLAVVAWVVCPVFFRLLGPDFESAVSPFRVLTLGFIARSIYILDNTYLDALGRTDVTFYSGLVPALVTVVLSLVLIPRYGMMGAAWATTISMGVSLVVRQVAVRYVIFHRFAVR